MSRYYVLMDYRVPILYKKDGFTFSSNTPLYLENNPSKKNRESLPSNYKLFAISPELEVWVVFYKENIGRLLIKSKSRRDAYNLANAIRGVIGIFWGFTPNNDRYRYFLEELKKIPKASWKDTDFGDSLVGEEIKDIVYLGVWLEEGWVLLGDIVEQLPSLVTKIYKDSDLLDAMVHLLESKFLFEGFMVGSYYHCHYRHDRKEMPKWRLEKAYLENRLRYELAFLAAFKGIERYFRVNSFRKSEIASLFEKVPYKKVSFNTEYTRYHEVFSGWPKKIKYGELLAHFLLMRNVVAAHGNMKLPENFIISIDNIYEIQLFLKELIAKAIF